MFDRILDWIDRGWGLIKPFFIVEAWEGGIVLRFGKYNRTVAPGFHWKIPLCEKPYEATTCETTWRSPAQPLTTKDDISVTIMTVVRYQIENVKPYLIVIHDVTFTAFTRARPIMLISPNASPQSLAN